MPTLENLGKLPQPINKKERAELESMIGQGYVFPKGKGYFTPDGLFVLSLKRLTCGGPIRPLQMWAAPLLNYDSESHRLASTPEGCIRIVQKNNLQQAVGLVTVDDIRRRYEYGSGQTVVTKSGFVLPPGNKHYFMMGDAGCYLSDEELLVEIKKGRSSRLWEVWQGFTRILDPSLAGKQVIRMNLEGPSYREDVVVLKRSDITGKFQLVKRVREYPFMSEDSFKSYCQPVDYEQGVI